MFDGCLKRSYLRIGGMQEWKNVKLTFKAADALVFFTRMDLAHCTDGGMNAA